MKPPGCECPEGPTRLKSGPVVYEVHDPSCPLEIARARSGCEALMVVWPPRESGAPVELLGLGQKAGAA